MKLEHIENQLSLLLRERKQVELQIKNLDIVLKKIQEIIEILETMSAPGDADVQAKRPRRKRRKAAISAQSARNLKPDSVPDVMPETKKRRRGRPPGSKNKTSKTPDATKAAGEAPAAGEIKAKNETKTRNEVKARNDGFFKEETTSEEKPRVQLANLSELAQVK